MSDLISLLQQVVKEAEQKSGIVRIPVPRDYVPCGWCGGGSISLGPPGCASCFNARRKRERELDEEFKAAFPDVIKPIMTADINNPEQMAAMLRAVGAEAITKAFSAGGGGMDEIMANIERERG